MRKIILALIAVLLVISCRNSNKAESIASLDREVDLNKKSISLYNPAQEKLDFFADSIGKPQLEGVEKKKQTQQNPPLPNPDWDKKIIKTASINIEIKDHKGYNLLLREKVKQFGGYIAQEEQTQSDYKIETALTIKVPVDQFDNLVTQLSNGAEKVNEKKITSQDVTAEVVDTKSRLEAKKQFRQRYMDLLKQAKNMEEILNVQSEINDIQEDIESAAGRIEYLSHSSAYSTVNLTYYQVLNASAKDNERPSFGTKLSNAFKTGWSWVGELFIGIISICPYCS